MAVRDQITGRTLGDFVVRDKLGEGGFGAVYRAEQPLLQREAVIKVLHRQLRASELVIQRFLREARLASQLDHPYAAHVYAFGAEPDGLLWIAMELVRGTPLDTLLKTQGTLPIERLVQLMDRICEVVHTAHEQGIVHRDIKPANVIVLSRAGRLLPKLLDFGIAKVSESELAAPAGATKPTPVPEASLAFDSTLAHAEDRTLSGSEGSRTPVELMSTPSSGLTRAGSLVGSPRYMAPEQWVNPSAADARADIYALGVLAYEALTGKPPFDGRTLFEVAAAHAEGTVPPLGETHPVALDGVFARALAKRPEDRYATALELANAFREASGLGPDAREVLPQLDETLRDALIADAPQPIAEAVAAVAAAHNARQARDAMVVLVHVAVRTIGVIALACRTRIGTLGGRDADPVIEALRSLRKRVLSDQEWLELARELCRPYAGRPDAFPIPELVTLLFDRGTQRPDLLDDSLGMLAQGQASGTSDDQIRDLLARALPALTQFLRSIAFLADYPLVVWRNDRAELWMGLRRGKRAALAIQGKPLDRDRPALVDRDGRPVLALWPLVQIGPPSPGAPDELFLFEGKGRHGARFVAMPQEFERSDDSLWKWFGEALLDTVDQMAATELETETPYRGLAAFTASDAALFFGREREAEAFVNRLRVRPLLAVVGPSGAGKSSFVQAGVIPALPADWCVLTVRPGPSPLVTLHARLSGLDGKRSASTTTAGLYALGEQLRTRARAANTTIVLVVDQFEELFTLCADEAERMHYAETLVRAARSAEDPVRIILTLRDDFLIAAEQLAPLRARLAQGLQLLATPARDDLLRIVTVPARTAGYEFEDRELPAQMVDAVAGRPGALALLSFSSARLWELRDRHFKQLGRRAYEAMGGVGGALAQHAETTLAELSPEEQRLVREAFRHLVTAEGTRAILTRPELMQILGSGRRPASGGAAKHQEESRGADRAETVVERLIAARLVVASEGEGGDERVEVIHEALLDAWPRLVEWRREDAEGARLRDQLRAAARQWQDKNRPKSLLWRAETLTEYQLWRSRHPGALTEVESAFAAASLAEAARGRRTRRGILALAFVSLGIVVAALTWFNREARRQTEQAQRHIVKLYTDQGRRALLDGYRQRALVFLAEAWQRGGRDPALQFLLRRAGTALEQEVATLVGHQGWVRDAVFSPDGRTVVTISDDHTARLWDAATGKARHELRGHRDFVRAVAFTPAGDAVLTVSWDRTARLWEVASGRQRWSVDLRDPGTPNSDAHGLTQYLSLPCAADISADGSRVIASCIDRRAAIISRDGVVQHWLPDHKPFVTGAAFSPDGQRALTIDLQGNPRLFAVTTGAQIAELVGHEGRTVTGSFSGDGSRILTVGRDGTARLWSAGDGKSLAILRGHQGTVWRAQFSRDGSRVISIGVDRTLRIWDGLDGHAITVLHPHDAPVLALDISPDGSRIFSGDQTGIGVLFNADGRRLGVFEGHKYMLWSAHHSADGSRLATASGDGTARIWGIPAGDKVERLVGHTAPVTGLKFSPVAPLLVTASDDAHVRVWKLDDARPTSTVLAKTEQPLIALQVSNDGAWVAAGSADGTTHVWELATGKKIHTLRGHRAPVLAIAFNPTHTLLGTTGSDGDVLLWDLATGKQLGAPLARGKAGNAIAFDPTGTLLAAGGDENIVRVFDTATRKEIRTLAHEAPIGQITFCGDRMLVASGAGIQMWSADGRSAATATAKGETMSGRCIDGRVVSAGAREIGISDLTSGTLLDRVEIPGADLLAVDVSAAGQIAVADLNGTVTLLRLEFDARTPDQLATAAKRALSLELSKDGIVRLKQ